MDKLSSNDNLLKQKLNQYNNLIKRYKIKITTLEQDYIRKKAILLEEIDSLKNGINI